jgi:hypothetical protein
MLIMRATVKDIKVTLLRLPYDSVGDRRELDAALGYVSPPEEISSEHVDRGASERTPDSDRMILHQEYLTYVNMFNVMNLGELEY